MITDIVDISANEPHLSSICTAMLFAIAKQQSPTMQNVLLATLLDMYQACQQGTIPQSNQLLSFELTEQTIDNAVHSLEQKLLDECPSATPLKQSISYLLDELICNIQQHAHADFGIAYISYNTDLQTIDIALADNGITIYGSYVKADKYLDLIGESDAEALGLAQEGYSTKDLPNAENRGYGISSNIKMVSEGLQGELVIISGGAMSLFTPNNNKLLSLPNGIEWNGTLIVARIPVNIPVTYNFYNYIS